MQNAVFKLIRNTTPLYYSWSEAMHTRLDIVLCDLSQEHAAELVTEMTEDALRLEKRLNRFDPNSDVSYLNNRAFKKELKLDQELFGILSHCQETHNLTQGFFDVGAAHTKTIEGEQRIFQLDSALNTVRFTSEGYSIDLGGYAKGLVLDRFKRYLWQKGVENYMISFGNSSVLATGAMPFSEGGWNVGIEDVYRINNSAFELNLLNCSLSTSGNAGRKGSHIVNPNTGETVEANATVTVVSESPLESEILSTALFAANQAEVQQEILTHFQAQSVYVVEYTDQASPPVLSQIL